MLHQMGLSRGDDPARYDRITAHYVLLPNGCVYQLHDHTVRLPASGAFNAGSISLEVAGNLPSRPRSTDRRHFWKPERFGRDQLTAAQIHGGRRLLTTLHEQGWLTHVLAHRQAGPKRENCPGPDVWRELGAWAVRQLGLQWGGPGFAIRGGKAVPDRWWGEHGVPGALG